MLHTQALVLTDSPGRVAAAMVAQLGMEFRTEWSAEAGSIALPDAVCDLHSWPEGLRLDAWARDDAALARVESVVAQEVARAAHGAPVDWRRRPSAR
jgi:hypothetical protein